MAAHTVSSTSKAQKCLGPCGKTLPLGHFGISKGCLRTKCCICRSEIEVAKNDTTRPSADRLGLAWERCENEFILEHKDLPDIRIARILKRTISAVRAQRCKLGQGRKRAKPAPKPLYNLFKLTKRDDIKKVSVNLFPEENCIHVWCNTNTLWINIHLAFKQAGLTDDDYKAWKIGVTAGA